MAVAPRRRAAAGLVTVDADRLLAMARRPLVLGIGGGGDVVGALATAEACRLRGAQPIVGGVSWERRPIDPRPGPRTEAEIADARPLGAGVLACTPATRIRDGGVRFAESRMAELLGEETVLVDVNRGPVTLATGIAEAAATLGCDLVVFVDVGGDALAHGDEAGLASPLCDAVMLAAAARMQRDEGRRADASVPRDEAAAGKTEASAVEDDATGVAAPLGGASAVAPAPAEAIPVLGGIFGVGCDGELTPAEVLERIAEIAAARGLAGSLGLTPAVAARLEEAVAAVPTEASAQALRCFRGEIRETTIRGGRRRVELSPVGAGTFYFDAGRAVDSAARLARAVFDAPDLETANDILHGLGVRTELDVERQPSK